MYKVILAITLSCFFRLVASGAGEDSLRFEIGKASEDTIKVKLLNRLAWELKKVNPDTAIILTSQAMALAKKVAYPHGRARGMLYQAIALKNKGDFPEALAHYKDAEGVFKRLKDSNSMAMCINGQGIVHKKIANYEMAMLKYQEAASLFKALGNGLSQAASLNNLGNLTKNNGDFKASINYHREALSLRKALGSESLEAYSYHNMANLYMKMEMLDSAYFYAEKALEIRTRDQENELSTSKGTMADVLLYQGRIKEALQYSQESVDLYLKYNDGSGYCSGITQMAKIALKTGDFAKAINYALEAKQLAEEMRLLDDLIEINTHLAEAYERSGKYDLALQAQKEIGQLRDSVFNENKSRIIQDLQTQYEVESIDRERSQLQEQVLTQNMLIEAKRAKEEIQDRFKVAMGTGIVLLLIVLGFIWRSNLIKKRTNQTLRRQQEEISQKNKDITDSINYAQKIQRNALPRAGELHALFEDSFVIYEPKDVIGGDFYWFAQVSNHAIVAVADCTGHGVPGALVAMTGLNLLHQIVMDRSISSPAQALKLLDEGIYKALSVTENSETKDGLDIALCAVDLDTLKLQFSGAARPLTVISKGELIVKKGNRNSIGGHLMEGKAFEDINIQLNKGDKVYMYSDGYADQFGMETGKKFKNKALLQMLLENATKGMKEQKKVYADTFVRWKGDLEQVDDTCMVGFSV